MKNRKKNFEVVKKNYTTFEVKKVLYDFEGEKKTYHLKIVN